MGEQVNSLIDQAINSRTSVGVIGLLGALYAGIGWITNLRAALTEQWEQQRQPGNFLVTKLRDFGALAGLGIAMIISFGVSAIGTGAVAERGRASSTSTAACGDGGPEDRVDPREPHGVVARFSPG